MDRLCCTDTSVVLKNNTTYLSFFFLFFPKPVLEWDVGEECGRVIERDLRKNNQQRHSKYLFSKTNEWDERRRTRVGGGEGGWGAGGVGGEEGGGKEKREERGGVFLSFG